MASYSIVWKSSAEHELRKLDKRYILKILSSIESLTENPFPSQARKLQGAESSYRIRIGDYRVIYQVDSAEGLITIYHVRHRKDVYRRN